MTNENNTEDIIEKLLIVGDDKSAFENRSSNKSYQQLLKILNNKVEYANVIHILKSKYPKYNNTFKLGTFNSYLFGCLLSSDLDNDNVCYDLSNKHSENIILDTKINEQIRFVNKNFNPKIQNNNLYILNSRNFVSLTIQEINLLKEKNIEIINVYMNIEDISPDLSQDILDDFVLIYDNIDINDLYIENKMPNNYINEKLINYSPQNNNQQKPSNSIKSILIYITFVIICLSTAKYIFSSKIKT